MFEKLYVKSENLNNADKNFLNNVKRNNKLLREKQEVVKESKNIESDIIENDIKADQRVLEAKTKKTLAETENIEIKNKLANAQMRNDFYNITNENKMKLLKDDKNLGDLFVKESYKNNITSTFTSIAGIIVPNIKYLLSLFYNDKFEFYQSIAIILVCSIAFCRIAAVVNKLIVDLPNQLTRYVDFNNKKNVQSISFFGSIIFISVILILSIGTNIMFWTSIDTIFKIPIICAVVYAFAFDYASILYSFVGYIHRELKYKDLFISEILNNNNYIKNNNIKNFYEEKKKEEISIEKKLAKV